MSWRDGVRLVHSLPSGASATFYNGKIIVVAPHLEPYTVAPETGAQRPIVLTPCVERGGAGGRFAGMDSCAKIEGWGGNG